MEIPNSNFEEPSKDDKEKFEKPTKEEFLALLKNKDYLDFVKKIKSLKYDAAKMGINLEETIKYLETGEGNPDIVRVALSKLIDKDAEEFKSATVRRGSPLSEKEIAEIRSKTKHGKLLGDFEFFMSLPALKRKIEAKKEEIDKSSQETITEEKITKEILPERPLGEPWVIKWESQPWNLRVVKAREEFQKNMWDTLRIVADFYKRFEHSSLPEEEIKEIQDKIDYYVKVLETGAEELANKYKISRGEIYSPEEPFDWYFTKQYLEAAYEEKQLRPLAEEKETSNLRKAFLEFKQKVEKISSEKAKCFDRRVNLSRHLSIKNLSPKERVDAEKEIEAINERIKEINEEIESKREEVAKQFGVSKNELKFDFDIDPFGSGREPFSSV